METHQSNEMLEIPVSELQALFDDLIQVYNTLNGILKDAGILRGRELAEINAKASRAVKAEKSPVGKLILLNAYIKQEIKHINDALKERPAFAQAQGGRIQQAITKIQLRACAIVEHVKTIAQGKKEVAFSSRQARDFLAGREGMAPSRRDTIRALRRAEKICPALVCGHTPGDGRQTTRVTARGDELKNITNIKSGCDARQRSKLDELKVIFFKEARNYA